MKNLLCRLHDGLYYGALLLTLVIFSEPSGASEVFKNFTERRFDSYIDVNYFKTESNFGKDGSQQTLPSGYSFQVTDILIGGRYVLIEDLGLMAGLSVGNSEAKDAISSRTNSTVNYVNLGADYLFYQSRMMSLYADGVFLQPIEKVAANTDSSLNSDGVSEFQAKITALFDLGYVQTYASGGFDYRLEGLSSLLTYSFGAQTSFSKFVLGASLNGFASVIDDSKTSTPSDRELITNRVDATSKRFYAINPNLLDSDLYIKYTFNSNFSVKANGGYTIVGSNAAMGYHVGLGVAWGFGGSHHENYSRPVSRPAPVSTGLAPQAPPSPRPVVKQPPHSAPQAITPSKKFQEDTNDGVNQDYFKPVAPAKDPHLDQGGNLPPTAEEEEDFKIKSKRAEPSNDNEYKIKLKKAKKKQKTYGT